MLKDVSMYIVGLSLQDDFAKFLWNAWSPMHSIYTEAYFKRDTINSLEHAKRIRWVLTNSVPDGEMDREQTTIVTCSPTTVEIVYKLCKFYKLNLTIYVPKITRNEHGRISFEDIDKPYGESLEGGIEALLEEFTRIYKYINKLDKLIEKQDK